MGRGNTRHNDIGFTFMIEYVIYNDDVEIDDFDSDLNAKEIIDGIRYLLKNSFYDVDKWHISRDLKHLLGSDDELFDLWLEDDGVRLVFVLQARDPYDVQDFNDYLDNDIDDIKALQFKALQVYKDKIHRHLIETLGSYYIPNGAWLSSKVTE
jgi:hypothetical protein